MLKPGSLTQCAVKEVQKNHVYRWARLSDFVSVNCSMALWKWLSLIVRKTELSSLGSVSSETVTFLGLIEYSTIRILTVKIFSDTQYWKLYKKYNLLEPAPEETIFRPSSAKPRPSLSITDCDSFLGFSDSSASLSSGACSIAAWSRTV